MSTEPCSSASTRVEVSRVGSTDYVGTTMTVPQSWYFLCSPVNLNPATSAQWSVAAFNAAEFGFKVVT